MDSNFFIKVLRDNELKLIHGGNKNSHDVHPPILTVTGGGTVDHGIHGGGQVTGHFSITDNITVHPYVTGDTMNGVTGGGANVTWSFNKLP